MATRARVAIEDNGKIIGSYVHWDGYPGGLGYNLINNWYDPGKLKEGIKLGDASSWGDDIDRNVYYKRDKNESNVDYRIYNSEEDYLKNADKAGEEFIYLGKKKGVGIDWFVANWRTKRLEPLEEKAIWERIEMLKENLKAVRLRKAS